MAGKLLRYDNHEITLINGNGSEITGKQKKRWLNYMRHQQRQKWEKEQRELAAGAKRARNSYRHMREKFGQESADIWAYRKLNLRAGGFYAECFRLKKLKDEYDAGLI